MISQAIQFLEDQLNNKFNLKLGIEEKGVVASSLVNIDGSVPSSSKNKIVLSIIHIQQETLVNSSQHTKQDNNFSKTTRPVSFNLYMQVTANYDASNYIQGLKMLSSVIEIFQENPYYVKNKYFMMPSPLTKLSLEIVNTRLEDMGSIWNVIGAKYQPSLVYKARVTTEGAQKDNSIPHITGIN